MTNPRLGKLYIDEACGRMDLVRLALERKLWAACVREAQECVELFLKGALRLVAVEPSRTHDPAAVLRRARDRFPAWFREHVERLAEISTQMAGDRGAAFYGDENGERGPQELFGEEDARHAVSHMELTARLCLRLLADRGEGGNAPER